MGKFKIIFLFFVFLISLSVFGGYYPWGDLHWKTPVDSVGSLPVSGNLIGDVRIETTAFGEYVWNGSSWQAISGGGGGGVSSVTASSPVFSSGGTTPNITCQAASGSQAGCLSSADWTTFNNKQSALTFTDSVSNTTGTVTLKNDSASPGFTQYYGTDGAGAIGYHPIPLPSNSAPPGGVNTDVQYNSSGSFGGDAGFTYNGSGTATLSAKINVPAANVSGLTASQPVFTDGSKNLASGSISGNTTKVVTTTGVWVSGDCVAIDASGNAVDFGAPCSSFTTGNLTDTGTDGIVVTGGLGAVVGSGTSIAQHVADTTHSGYLSTTDWNTFNGKQSTVSFAAVGAAPSANAGGISSGVITLQPFDGTHPGVVTASGGGTTNFLRADNTWAAAGGGGTPGGSSTQVQYNSSGSFGGDAGFTYDGSGNTTITGKMNSASANISGLTASVPVFTDGSKNLTSSGTVPIGQGGTGQTTAATAFNALSPMTTGGDLIYGGASGAGTRLPNGSANQILTSAGGTSAPAWATNYPMPSPSPSSIAMDVGGVWAVVPFPSPSPSGQYVTTTGTGFALTNPSVAATALSWSGYHDSISGGCAASSSTFSDPSACTGITLHQIASNNLTCSTASSSAPGITCTLPVGLYSLVGSATMDWAGSGGRGGVRLVDGSGTVISPGMTMSNPGSETWTHPFSGFYNVTTAGSFTFKVQIANNNALTTNIDQGPGSTGYAAINWSISSLTTFTNANVSSSGAANYHTESALIGSGSGTLSNAGKCASGSCSVVGQTGNWITSITHVGTGVYSFVIATGEFSQIPFCTCSDTDFGASQSWCDVNYSYGSISPTAMEVVSETSAATADAGFTIICMGPR